MRPTRRPILNMLALNHRPDAPAPSLALLLDSYKAEFELMCIQFLSGGWKLALRDSVMALYRAGQNLSKANRESLDELLITDGETVRALLELADARGPAELQVCEAQLRRLRRRHTELVMELRQGFAPAGA